MTESTLMRSQTAFEASIVRIRASACSGVTTSFTCAGVKNKTKGCRTAFGRQEGIPLPPKGGKFPAFYDEYGFQKYRD
jgi:hypothetical protein